MNMNENWMEIRSKADPSEILKHSNSDEYLYCSHSVSSPFGEEDKEEGYWLSSSKNELFAYFKEIVLREMLFEDYVNGDAVPELQKHDFGTILDLLIDGAKKGELDGWHDGLSTLLEISAWSEDESNIDYKKLETILRKHNLNLHVEHFASLEEAKRTDSLKRESLNRFLGR